jgi:hypothetical protein
MNKEGEKLQENKIYRRRKLPFIGKFDKLDWVLCFIFLQLGIMDNKGMYRISKII